MGTLTNSTGGYTSLARFDISGSIKYVTGFNLNPLFKGFAINKNETFIYIMTGTSNFNLEILSTKNGNHYEPRTSTQFSLANVYCGLSFNELETRMYVYGIESGSINNGTLWMNLVGETTFKWLQLYQDLSAMTSVTPIDEDTASFTVLNKVSNELVIQRIK